MTFWVSFSASYFDVRYPVIKASIFMMARTRIIKYKFTLFLSVWSIPVTLQSALIMQQVDIISPGFFDWTVPVTLSNTGPAFDTGMDILRTKYPDYNWTHEFLLDKLIGECTGLTDNIQYVLSRWFYTVRRKDVLSVIVTPGKCKHVTWPILSPPMETHLRGRDRCLTNTY